MNYKYNIQKIEPANLQKYSFAPINGKDVYYYKSNSTNTIFGFEVLAVYLNTDYNGKISNIFVIPRKPDDNKLILDFYQSEFGTPYMTNDGETNDELYIWQGDEIALRLRYHKAPNYHSYCIIEYLVSFIKLQNDK